VPGLFGEDGGAEGALGGGEPSRVEITRLFRSLVYRRTT
jgi:hypothetical protein